MKFSEISNNDDVKRTLAEMADSGRVPHAMMFHEDEGSGAFAIAQAFLARLYSHGDEASDEFRRVSRLMHPDIHYVFPLNSGSKVTGKIDELSPDLFMDWFRELALGNPYFTEAELYDAIGIEGKSGIISVGAAKSILDKLMLTSVEGGWKSVVIWLPERMNAQAANRLLKIIEEPPEQTLFLLITQAPDKVLTTIASRCQRIRIMPRAAAMGGADYQANMELFRQLADALRTRNLEAALDVGEAMAALDSRDRQKSLCRFCVGCLRKLFLTMQGLGRIAGFQDGEEAYFTVLSASFRKSFPRMAASAFDRAVRLIERNVNQKIVFCDLVGRLYSLQRQT